jgi:hypothetical protein
MLNTKKRIVSVGLAAFMMCGTFVALPQAKENNVIPQFSIVQEVEASAAYVTKGCFNGDSYSGWTYVYPQNSRKSSKIKVCAFRENGKINSGKFKVQIYSANGNYVDTVSVSGSGYITLNSGYSGYKVRFIRNNPWSRDGKKAADNRAKTVYWSLDRYKNLYY